ncbi:hypothetical protein CDAR_253471 [Caerostris darwini]|uniref:Uncharacterized protein n=1 Tax=Caerostris darwini TaxID=1538125 RepID=A0AAV4MJC3_9ARAC|nr:hypothetical protein CDAR_253471 [Caerostris darwini]
MVRKQTRLKQPRKKYIQRNLLPHKHYRKFTPHCSLDSSEAVKLSRGWALFHHFPHHSCHQQSSLLLRHWKTIPARWAPELNHRIVSAPGGGQAVSACQQRVNSVIRRSST